MGEKKISGGEERAEDLCERGENSRLWIGGEAWKIEIAEEQIWVLDWRQLRIDWCTERESEREREEMKVQCDVCEKAEATVICCADEAALCEQCDEKVHAANKLAGKHQRVAILGRSSSLLP